MDAPLQPKVSLKFSVFEAMRVAITGFLRMALRDKVIKTGETNAAGLTLIKDRHKMRLKKARQPGPRVAVSESYGKCARKG